MRKVSDKIARSNFYHLITAATSANHIRIARFDAWGVVIVIALLVGMVDLVRLVLAM
ncbi:MAG: hypothetical protein ACREFE_04710 [Limisphaerales bacterium]